MSKKYKTPYRSDGIRIYREDIHVANWTKEGYECLEEFKNYRLAVAKFAKKFASDNPFRFPSGGEGEVEPEEVVEKPEDDTENEYHFRTRDLRSGGEKFDKGEVYLAEQAPERLPSLGDLTPEYCQWYADTYKPERFKQKYRNHIRQKIEPAWSIYNETVKPKEDE